MTFIPFDLERWQSEWEHRVRFNLSESGVHPLTLGELLSLTDTDPDELHRVRLGYSQTDGTDALREAIAELYPGATSDNVLVTVGSSEANFVVCWSLLGPGEKVAIQLPTYMQTWGLARNFGADITTFSLTLGDDAWTLDADAVRTAVRPGTSLVVVTNPNNPTGHVLGDDGRRAIAESVGEAGSWLLVDEVYRGAERDGTLTESFWGTSPRTIVSGGLSKAYGIPGLRIGWIVAPPEFIQTAVRRHDYTVIGPSAVSDFLAIRALSAAPSLLARTRRILTDNYPTLHDWLSQFGELFEWAAPDAGAICMARYRLDAPGLELVERLRTDNSVLLVPGEHFDMPHHLRFGYGGEPADLEGALAATAEGLRHLIGD